MAGLFANNVDIPSEVMCKIVGMLDADDIPKLSYVSKNWYSTCKRSSFINKHRLESRLTKYKHMLFCLPEEEGPALPFFLQLDPVVEDERTLANFSRVPNFFDDKLVTFVGCDEGVLCFRTNVDNGGDRFKLWNPVTCQSVDVGHPAGLSSGMNMRCGFGYDHHTQEFYIPVIWDLPQEPEQTFMSVFCSFSHAWCDVPQTRYAASLLYDSSVYVNGCVNWLSTKKDTSHDNCHVVVSFKLQDRSWRITKVPFPVSDTEWGFINVEDTLGIATWSNVTEYHKTYVIWLSRELDGGEIGWQQFKQIDRSPAILRFLSFAGEYLICVSEKLQSYDEDEHTFFQGLIFLKSHQKGIIRLMTTHCTSPFFCQGYVLFLPNFKGHIGVHLHSCTPGLSLC